MKKIYNYLKIILYFLCVFIPANVYAKDLYTKKDVVLIVDQTSKISLYTAKGIKIESYISSNPNIVKINSKTGKIRAISSGNAKITVKYKKNGKTKKQKICIDVINPSKRESSLVIEQCERATLYLDYVKNEKIQWKSSDNSIVGVSRKGVVYAKKPGKVQINATILGKTYSYDITVKPYIENGQKLRNAILTGDVSKLSKTEKKVAKKAKQIIKRQIKSGMSDFQKVLAIHDYIVLNTKYDYDNYTNNTVSQSAYSVEGVLLNEVGVSEGYAETFKLFMDVLNIDCKYVSGKSTSIYGKNESHVWNNVKIDDFWYAIDCTLDDPIPNQKNGIRYNYFLLSNDLISKDHIWDQSTYPVTGFKTYADEVCQSKNLLSFKSIDALKLHIDLFCSFGKTNTLEFYSDLNSDEISNMKELNNNYVIEIQSISKSAFCGNYYKYILSFSILSHKKQEEQKKLSEEDLKLENYVSDSDSFFSIFKKLYEEDKPLVFRCLSDEYTNLFIYENIRKYANENNLKYSSTEFCKNVENYKIDGIRYKKITISNPGLSDIDKTDDSSNKVVDAIDWSKHQNVKYNVNEIKSFMNDYLFNNIENSEIFTPAFEINQIKIRQLFQEIALENNVDYTKYEIFEFRINPNYSEYYICKFMYGYDV